MSSRMGIVHRIREDVPDDGQLVGVIDGLRIFRQWSQTYTAAGMFDSYPPGSPWVLDGVALDFEGRICGFTERCVETWSVEEALARVDGFAYDLLHVDGVELSPRFLARLNGVRDAEAVASLGRSDAERRIGS
jgi:hypothetical protein